MSTSDGHTHISGPLVVATLIALGAMGAIPPQPMMPARDTSAAAQQETSTVADHPYIGMWVTADGRIRQELLPNGRYDEARGSRPSAYTGRYEVRGAHIDYWDDTGFTADGTFVSDDELHHGGMVFYREK